MIINESRLKVLDNSGALTVKCFRVFKRKSGTLGSLIMVSVKSFRPGKKVKKGEVYKGIIIHLSSLFRRKEGNYLKFDNNAVILWKRKEDSPLGTRIRTIVPLELRFLGYMKIVLLAAGTY